MEKRYKPILDVLVDDTIEGRCRYDKIIFDHNEDDLEVPYRNICELGNASLYKIPKDLIREDDMVKIELLEGRKRQFQKKQSDVIGISNNKVVIIVEEEKDPKRETYDIKTIKDCNYMITRDNQVFSLNRPTLFILLQAKKESEVKNNEIGCLNKVVVCSKDSFKDEYTRIMSET